MKEEQKESPWKCFNLCYESSPGIIRNSQIVETVDLSNASHDLITADDPPSKKTKLDFKRIIMGEKLLNLDINATQRMLKQQFPNIHGLE